MPDETSRNGGSAPDGSTADGSARDDSTPDDSTAPSRLTAWVRGRVQGVGFRWWVRSQALELGLTGSASNLDDGRVEVVVEGSRSACEELLDRLRSGRGPGRVTGVAERWSTVRDGRGPAGGFVER